MKRLTAQWVRKAESDYAVAQILARRSDPHHDEACFHCQQCAEKYLKALLEELAQVVPRTHILDDLVVALLPHHPSLRSFRALRWAGKMRGAARSLLHLRAVP